MNSSKRGCVYGFKLQSLDLVSMNTFHMLSLSPPTGTNRGKFYSIQRPAQIYGMQFICVGLLLTWPFLNIVTQLLDTKSTDRKMTLLHYIALIVKEKYPELANFYNELHFVDKAAAGEFI